MEERIKQLENEVADLKRRLESRDINQIQIPLDEISKNVLKQAAFLTGNVLKGSHTYYVAVSSGGPVTTSITFTDGVQTA